MDKDNTLYEIIDNNMQVIEQLWAIIKTQQTVITEMKKELDKLKGANR